MYTNTNVFTNVCMSENPSTLGGKSKLCPQVNLCIIQLLKAHLLENESET